MEQTAVGVNVEVNVGGRKVRATSLASTGVGGGKRIRAGYKPTSLKSLGVNESGLDINLQV